MAVPCPHCNATLEEQEIQETVTGVKVCPHCQRALEESPAGPDAPATKGAASKTPLSELPSDKRYTLEVLDGNEPGRVFTLEKPSITIGRRGSDVNLDDPEISRHHASIEIHGTNATLRDLGSTNGTYIRGQRVEEGDLVDNSEFRVGTHQLVFHVTFRAFSKS
ncbi:MAG TPA: FHA domain-containing protein [Vicinamibacteria bacterium]